MKTLQNDTIAAIITPLGEGGIAVLRLSGPAAMEIADTVFRGGVRLMDTSSHTVHFGRIQSGEGVVVDEVLATVFRSPHSYTAEDVVEISCHGSVFLARKILDLLVRQGARLAEPGEFTKRAFLNGRFDLSQAEAVADLIRANSEVTHNQAIAQLRGSLSKKIEELRTRIIDICSMMELELDFSEEGLEIVEKKKLEADLKQIESELSYLIDSFEVGKIQREGYRVVLVGPPNVGKSSILNALVRENRAIVTDVSGTTRDTIEEEIIIAGVHFNIVDTAGLRSTDDAVETEGIKRTIQQVSYADLVLLVVDSTKDIVSQGDIDFIDNYLKSRSRKDLIVVINKIDCVTKGDLIQMEKRFSEFDCIGTAAIRGSGIENLEKLIHRKAVESMGESYRDTILVSNLRQRERLESSKRGVQGCREGLIGGKTSDLLAVDLRESLRALSQVIGQDISDEVLNNVFSKFCIGK